MQWWLWLLIASAPVLLALFILYFGMEAARWDRRMQAAIRFIPEEEGYRIALPFWLGTRSTTFWGVLYRDADGWRVKDSGWYILRWRDDTSNRAHRAHPNEKVWPDPWAAERIIRKSVVSTLALIMYNDARKGKPLAPRKCRARARLRWVGLQTNDAALERAKLFERRAEFERRD